ncbi:uncharacterized protein AB675_11902 [Cyphellophora attinorum]|uniref:Uncharacterized protein n=1 Tax=Cyphellophora attinorum TaxID=1664694 RepID=A0A0N1GXG4_9EURO|nr:uncharacterized protein AB675_11902 [Phialophora attinorum]KPI35006.1 hypothetical protein AB675_11902 [Phialophora attinorum]
MNAILNTVSAPLKVVAGPITAVAATTGTVAAGVTPYLLPIVGFGAKGITAGSAAAAAQGALYAGAVPAGGWFATLTSWGMTGAATGVLGAAALPVGVVVGAGVYVAGRALVG